MMIVYTIWRRGSLWLKVQGDREIQRLEDERLQALQVAQALDVPVPNFKPIVRSMKTTVQERVFGLAVALILIVLGVALFATLFSLIQPNPALRVNMLFYLPWTLLTSSPALPLAAVLSGGASLLLAAESQWYQATELKHDFINWLTKVIVVLAVIASIGLAVYAVYRAQVNTNIIGVAVAQFQEALMTPNIWTLIAQTVVRTVFLIVMACVALVVIVLAIAVLAGGGGGSTAGAGAGGGGGGYAGGGSSSAAVAIPSVNPSTTAMGASWWRWRIPSSLAPRSKTVTVARLAPRPQTGMVARASPSATMYTACAMPRSQATRLWRRTAKRWGASATAAWATTASTTNSTNLVGSSWVIGNRRWHRAAPQKAYRHR